MEFPIERSTIMIPWGLPIPQGEFEVSLLTEWSAVPGNKGAEGCSHACSHVTTSCSHDDRAASDATTMILGGQKVECDTPVWHLMHEVIRAW